MSHYLYNKSKYEQWDNYLNKIFEEACKQKDNAKQEIINNNFNEALNHYKAALEICDTAIIKNKQYLKIPNFSFFRGNIEIEYSKLIEDAINNNFISNTINKSEYSQKLFALAIYDFCNTLQNKNFTITDNDGITVYQKLQNMLKNKSKKYIFESIKMLSFDKKKKLLELSLDKNTLLGKKIYEVRFFLKPGTPHEMNEYLKEIKQKQRNEDSFNDLLLSSKNSIMKKSK
jgi:hypothetical protein